MLNLIGLAAIVAILMLDYLFFRVVLREFAWVADRLPEYRPNGSYKSQSSPDKYARYRKSRNGR